MGIGIILLTFDLKGQSISEFFKLVPTEYVDSMSVADRVKLMNNDTFYPKDNDDSCIEEYHLEYLDTERNFLRVESDYKTGQAAYGIIELRSFTKKNGNKILVVSNGAGIHQEFHTNEIVVFDYQKGKLQISRTASLPSHLDVNNFIKTNTPDSLKTEYLSFSGSYDLGIIDGIAQDVNGKTNSRPLPNITYKLYDQEMDWYNIDGSYLLGNTIEFIWNGDRFVRQKVTKKDK